MRTEHTDNVGLDDLSGRVICCAFAVLDTARVGFLEKVCEHALTFEVRTAGCICCAAM
jgi:hypothetical protein